MYQDPRVFMNVQVPTQTQNSSLHRTILGVRFVVGSSEEAARRGLSGGLVVVPAAPALVEIVRDSEYREAARSADLVLTDSGFMVLGSRKSEPGS